MDLLDSWEVVGDTSWAANPGNSEGVWYVEAMSVPLATADDVIEHLSALIYDDMSKLSPGGYLISGEALLVFEVSNIEVEVGCNVWDVEDGDWDTEPCVYADDAVVMFNATASYVADFRVIPQ